MPTKQNMKLKTVIIGILVLATISCNSEEKEALKYDAYPDVKIVGAMKNVMWKGELGSSINLDTIEDKQGLYGLGPESFLAGELLINNGQCYLSKVTSDSTMSVEKTFNTSAPFLVYANVKEWEKINLPQDIRTIADLEGFIDNKSKESKRPFAYKLIGTIKNAVIHIQDLPSGAKVSSPEEAHQGQVKYNLGNENVEIVGFFSTEHKGVFTHHDSFLHMHLITQDESKMGHLDEVEINSMMLYLPRK